MALTGESVDPAIFRRSTRKKSSIETILEPARSSMPRHFVDAYLDVAPARKAAMVTITRLRNPFEETVDLSVVLKELPPAR